MEETSAPYHEETETTRFNYEINYPLEAIRLIVLCSSLIAFSCLASIQNYTSSSALGVSYSCECALLDPLPT